MTVEARWKAAGAYRDDTTCQLDVLIKYLVNFSRGASLSDTVQLMLR